MNIFVCVFGESRWRKSFSESNEIVFAASQSALFATDWRWNRHKKIIIIILFGIWTPHFLQTRKNNQNEKKVKKR